jgi:cytoskeletal protein RodZ
MERIGEKLRRRREELGFTVEDIARATKYRPDVIQAVEEGRAGVFPAEAYRQAFLRAYADKLGLDANEVVREQKSEEERVREALKGIRLKARTGPRLGRTLVWLIVVVAAAAALLVVYDRVIRARGPEEPAGRALSPVIGTPESTFADRPDSQAVVGPGDSTGIEPAPEGTDDRDAGQPGETPEGEETGAPAGDTGEEEADPGRQLDGGVSLRESEEDRDAPEDRPVEGELSLAEREEDREPAPGRPGERDASRVEPEEEQAEAMGEPEASGISSQEPAGEVGLGEMDEESEDTVEISTLGEARRLEEGWQEQELAEIRPGGAEAAGEDCLNVRVRGYAVRARLRAGDSVLVDGWLRPNFSRTFCSNQPFWADTIIADGNSMSLVLNGERVDLPSASGSVITDFRISP